MSISSFISLCVQIIRIHTSYTSIIEVLIIIQFKIVLFFSLIKYTYNCILCLLVVFQNTYVERVFDFYKNPHNYIMYKLQLIQIIVDFILSITCFQESTHLFGAASSSSETKTLSSNGSCHERCHEQVAAPNNHYLGKLNRIYSLRPRR